MFGLLRKLMGMSVPEEILKADNLMVIDVRTPGEYKSGHIPGSVNIPLNTLDSQLKKIGKGPIVLCCASGTRSGIGVSTLKVKGLTQVYNGGSWTSLQRDLEKIG
jgi:phage shock protein E